VIFNEHVRVEKVLKIPHEIIGRYASYREHVNAHILVLQNNILANPLTEDITFLFRDY
jgi:hypothetical protein